MAFLRNFNGKLDLDTHPFRMMPNDYINAFNITKDSEGQFSDGIVQNIVGNRQIVYTLPAGSNTCIGASEDELRARVYYFIFNSNGNHCILYLDIFARTVTKVLISKTDSAGIDILNLQLLYKVGDIYIIHRNEDGDLLLFNDGYNKIGQLNVTEFVGGVYVPVTDDLIRLQRMPSVDEPVAVYSTDVVNKTNNLKKKLFQFCFAWGYKNGEISTISPYSKVALPQDAYTVDTETNPSNNNQILLTVTAGGADSKFIRIFARQSIGEVFGNWFVVDTLNLDDYDIPPGGTYTYVFLNDREYPTTDQLYTDLLWDYIPNKANALSIANGNYVLLGGITDGYDQIKRSDINVQLSATYKPTGSGPAPATPSIGPPFIGVSGGKYYIYFPVGASVGGGTVYKIKFTWAVSGGSDLNIDVTYPATGGDTAATVAGQLVSLVSAQASGKPFTVSVTAGTRVNIQNQQSATNGYKPSTPIYSATPAIQESGANAVYKCNTKYRLGLVYVDKYGKSNGVISFVASSGDPNDFSVTTPDFFFDLTLGTPFVPVLLAIINHLPPSWAVAYYWVRVAQTRQFLQYITSEVQSESGYFYFGIENLEVFRTNNSGFVPSYAFQIGDRVRVLAQYNNPGYDISNAGLDYEILGTVDRQMAGGTTNGLFIKVKQTTSPPAYGSRMMIEIYSPSLQPTSETTQVFYGFGESYPIYTDGAGNRYHVGKDQNQTATQPATFTFNDGDVYYKFRDFYPLKADGTIDIQSPYSAGVMDVNYSDYFNSAINSNGAAWAIDPNAKLLYNPVQINFSKAYQPGTDINGLNRFYPDNFIEVIRDYGDIKKLFPWNNGQICAQRHKIGNIPVLQNVLSNVNGSNNVVVSDKLLNRIQYYLGEAGVGDVPESMAWNNKAVYFWDNTRGVCCRISQNGLEFLSIVHKINSYAVQQAGARGFNYKIYGVFDTYTNKYITTMEATPDFPAQTIVWSEGIDGFESFMAYTPEMMVSINNLLITFKSGQIYTHDNPTFNNFYGVDFESSITAVFNDLPIAKKTFGSLTLISGQKWDIPSLTTNIMLSETSNINLSTSIAERDFLYQEGEYHAAIPNNKAGLQVNGPNGQTMKGQYATIKFRKASASNFVFLNTAILEIKESQKNAK